MHRGGDGINHRRGVMKPKGIDAQDIAWHQSGYAYVPAVMPITLTKPDAATQKYLDAMREINRAYEDRLRRDMGTPLFGG